ncbi:ABC transporter permease [Promethearchaeum syntrophicum]|uniref:ABC transporter permease n=1 Tax=Promethearchaeum syntrophicum TaxID=2594042 RepID=A0A5B9D5M3_9ARCH|nr:FtsX-like permease family protein [Candidatus Prometheoarchaeum syntrophicum]QEE14362.1 FtsX-like permease family protein [Candidatus Prometheoarchaeum syntrophicum]
MHLTKYLISFIKKYKIRYIACIIGFSMALGAIFATTSYSEMLNSSMNRLYFVKDDNFMILSKGTSIIQIIPYDSKVTENVSHTLDEIPGVNFAFPLIFKNFGNETQINYFKTTILGIKFTFLIDYYLKDVELKEGKWPEEGKNETIIGPDAGGGTLNVNDSITILNKQYKITGILESDSVFLDRFVYVEYEDIQELYGMDGFCSVYYVIGDAQIFSDSNQFNLVKAEIETEHPYVEVIGSELLDEAAGNIFKVFDALQVILAIFPLAISVIFIFILMMLNVKDQMREFGMLQAIGMSSSRIGLIIFLQTLLITILGYILSIFTGLMFLSYSFYLMDEYTTRSTNGWNYALSMKNKIPSYLYLQIFIGAILIGILVAIYPSIKATRVSIVKSFRKEE